MNTHSILQSHDYGHFWMNRAFLISKKLLDGHLNKQDILQYVKLRTEYILSIPENKIPALKCNQLCKKKKY